MQISLLVCAIAVFAALIAVFVLYPRDRRF